LPTSQVPQTTNEFEVNAIAVAAPAPAPVKPSTAAAAAATASSKTPSGTSSPPPTKAAFVRSSAKTGAKDASVDENSEAFKLVKKIVDLDESVTWYVSLVRWSHLKKKINKKIGDCLM